MPRIAKLILVAATWVAWVAPARGQTPPDPGKGAHEGKAETAPWVEQVFSGAAEEVARSQGLGDLAMPPDPGEIALRDSATRSDYLQSVRAYFAYRQLGYEHRMSVFRWQHASSIAIFLVVLGLVSLGMYFAWVQFHRAGMGKTESAEDSEIELSIQKVRVRSSVLGVLILSLSLGFFYLYLAFVYPIHDAF
jgi:hypothetical protein